MSEWITGFLQLMQPLVLLCLLLGVVVGAVIGALPGLSATMGIAILTPITFWMPAAQGFAMLIGLWNSAIWAGGISAVLINTPGTPASIASTFDGYAMYKQGRGGLALGINTIYSAIGGLLSTVALIFFSFPLAKFAITFGPTEYFALALFGISMMITVSGTSVLKGITVGFLGLLLSTVGLDPILSVKRYTLGSTNLLAGISFLPVMIGMFGIGEVLFQIFEYRKSTVERENREKAANLELGRIIPTPREARQLVRPTLLSAIISIIVGAIPAAGGDIASIICWGQARKISKHPEEYGKGSVEGFAVSCTANNGVIGGALTTMLTLGIPGDSVSAILIGSLTMYGMQPGPKMFTDNKPFVINIMLLMIFANILMLVFGLITAKVSAKVLNVRQETVWLSVCLLCVVGSYALNNNFFDVLVMAVAGLLGFVFKRGGYPVGPFILGLLLGGMLESNLRRALVMSGGSYAVFVTRPITLVLLLLILVVFLYPVVKSMIQKRRTAVQS